MTTLVRRMLTVLVPAALVLLLASPAWPTAQIPERIVYEGTEGFLFTEPAGDVFHQGQPPPGIRRAPHGLLAGLRRRVGNQGGHPVPHGHQGLDEGRPGASAAPVAFEKVFPGKAKPLKAEWFTGTLRIPQGKPIQYVHMGYQTVYEVDVFLTIEAGKVIDRQTIDNRNKVPADVPAPLRIG